jgi:hypothetical protein
MVQISFTLSMKYSNWPVHISPHILETIRVHQNGLMPILDEHRSSPSRLESHQITVAHGGSTPVNLVYYNAMWVTKQLS